MENENIKSFFDNIASKTAITLLGVIAASITIFAFFQDKSVNLCYEITSNTNVLDFNADISKLEVFYDSTNLKQTHENLRIYTVKIINNGSKDIIKEYFDDNEPIGLKISSGKIIELPELIQTSSDYLKRNAKILNYSKEKINFSQIILETGEFFTYKLLVLHTQDSIPEIQSFGKVAGQKEILVKNSIDVTKEISFWNRVYGGNIWVQILRIFSYLIGVALIIALIIGISDIIDSKKEERRKVKLTKAFMNLKEYEYTRMDDAIFDRYEEDGAKSFKKMQALIQDEEELNKIYTDLKTKIKSKEYRRYRHVDDGRVKYLLESNSWTVINEMIKDGIIFKDKDRLNINQAMKDTLDKFIFFLEENGEFKKKRFAGGGHIEREIIESIDE